MTVRKVVIGADVILAHLQSVESPSVLRKAMKMFFCYTTVIEAIEVFGAARTPREEEDAAGAMGAMKLLGLNARSAMAFAGLRKLHPAVDRWDLLTPGLCVAAGLPLMTSRGKLLARIRGLVVIPPSVVRSAGTADEVLAAVRG